MAVRPFEQAVVCGGSISGLLAAQVLSRFFRRVVLVEREALSAAAEPRRCVPQGRHVHVLLARGRTILERLFPGLSEELCAAGAVLFDGGRQLAWHHDGAWRTRYDGGLTTLAVSRPLLEATIAGRVRALPNLSVVKGRPVAGLRGDGAAGVNGVQLGATGAGGERAIEADLVVDAMGRGSRTPRWLQELAFPPPDEELVGARVAYASATFRRADCWPDWRALLITGSSDRRAAAVLPIEDQRWIVTLISLFDEPSPRDHDAFRGFAASLPVDTVRQTIGRSEALSDVVHHRFPGNLRRRYENLGRFPQGLIVMGDALCSFNPIYGQGMTVSATEAESLAEALEQAKLEGGLSAEFPLRWLRACKPVADTAWNGALVEDFRFPELVQQRPVHLRPLQWYASRVHRATWRSAAVTDQFYRVVNFLDAPTALLRPGIMAEVLFGSGSR